LAHAEVIALVCPEMRDDRFMVGDLVAGYLSGLPPARAEELARVNGPGLTALERYLASGQAVAFLGAGVSAPLYPMWDGLIGLLVESASARLDEQEAATLQVLARQRPEAAVEIVRQQLQEARYQEVLREVLRMRTDPETGASWTDVQELVCRCVFKAVVTTNYDPGIVNARMRVRPGASATGFTTWQDELSLDRWRTGDVFGEDELPVLFAHGQHNRPDSVVLATTEYRRAYQGKLPHVLGQLMDTGHLVWIGFSFADQRIAAIMREIAETSGTRVSPGTAARHVAIMPWDPADEGNDPGILARLAEIEYGAQAVLYPAPGDDHSALVLLLAKLTDSRFPAAGDLPARPRLSGTDPDQQAIAGEPRIPAEWVPAAEPVENFTGRAEELARLDRWAADPQVALIGVTAWGGAGKTALVTHWVTQAGGLARRPGLRGLFGWSFYADPSAEHWADGLLKWARRDLGIKVAGTGRLAAAVLALLWAVPLLLVLDGLERVQEGPAGGEFGRLLDGTLREVLAGACQQPHGGLVVLTSRFPFADLEGFDGGSARMLEVPPFTPAEGSALLAATGGDWLAEDQRRELVRAVDGHALATGALAGLLAARPPSSDLGVLHADLAAAARTDARVGKVLEFYASRLTEADRYLLAAVSLFARPVSAEAVLAVADHEAFEGRLAGWTLGTVQAAVRDRLAGLATWHPDGTISAHPLVRDTFRPLALQAANAAADTSLTGLPRGEVTSRADALRVTEAIELLLDAGQWQPADNLVQSRCGSPVPVWMRLSAGRLGQRTAGAFVATPARRVACATQLTPRRFIYYLGTTGLYATYAGDLTTARDYLTLTVHHCRDSGELRNLAASLRNLADCLGRLGQVGPAWEAAAESLTCAETSGDRDDVRQAHAYLGWLASQAGDTVGAENHFTTADQMCLADRGEHLHLVTGTWWAQVLGRTGRPGPAQDLSRRNADTCRKNGWNASLAWSDQILGALALAASDAATARTHLTAAVAAFRDGDLLTELAAALPSLAACAQATGDLDTAQRHLAEAITIAAPRSLIPAHATALAARARLRAAQATAGNTDALAQGRDDADAARRLAVRHQLPWHELDALTAHADLDEAEGTSHGWAAQAAQLQAQLVPPGLDPNPLVTVERLVEDGKAKGNDAGDNGAANPSR
jgi:tetratricopeptide (TPR) repeat protein